MAAPQTIAGYAPQRAAYYHPGYGGYAVPVAAQQPYAAYRPVAVAPQTPALPPGYHVGSGILGQPTIYGDGQPLRNFFRYLSL